MSDNLKLELTKTQKEYFNVDLRYEDGSPFNLSDATEITVLLPGEADGSVVDLKLSTGEVKILSACAGKILCVGPGSKMAQLRVGEDMDWEIVVIHDNDLDDPTVVQFRESLTVLARIFSNS